MLLKVMAKGLEILPVCPEVLGGLPVPRPRAEIHGGEGRDILDGNAKVVNEEGEDVTEFFLKGAKRTLELCRENGVSLAVLKSRSPSCGVGDVYDGTFAGNSRDGDGVTTSKLKRAGIRCVAEDDPELENLLSNEEG